MMIEIVEYLKLIARFLYLNMYFINLLLSLNVFDLSYYDLPFSYWKLGSHEQECSANGNEHYLFSLILEQGQLL